MKKIKLLSLALFSFTIVSCGAENEEPKEKEPETFDEKKAAVCECFDKGDDSRMNCFELQHKYSETFEEDERVRFIQETNQCGNF